MPRPAKRVELSSPPELNVSSDKVAFIIEKAREFDVKEGLSDPNSGSNPIDDRDADVLEDKPGDATRQELFDAIRALNEDERNTLIALAWVGRGTYSLGEWQEALDTAYAEHGKRPATYLLSLPLLGDYLQDGLDAFGIGIVDDTARPEGRSIEDNS